MAVVGAGPAGAFAAYRLARAGIRTLLIDRQAFPRAKVCGGCLNARTLALLARAGLEDLPVSLGGVPLEQFELRAAGRAVRLAMPGGVAVSRSALDAGLVRAAIGAGAHFLPETRAVLGPLQADERLLELPGTGVRIRARRVIAADGLCGSLLSGSTEHRSRALAGSRIGAGAVLEEPRGSFRPGVLHMVVGRRGYVGVTRVEDGRLAVAAALDRAALELDGGLDGAITRLLHGAGLPALRGAARWRGTAALTRQAPRPAFERVFLIGDAVGYVEPFTGEGISWALEGAGEVASLLVDGDGPAPLETPEAQWNRSYRRRIVRRQRWCRGVSWALRKPLLVASASRALALAPALAAPLLGHLNAVPKGEPS